MNSGPLIFLGLLFTMVWSWYGIVAKSFHDLSRLPPGTLPTGEKYPGGRSGTQNLGQEVYQANGCFACHTMQVRMKGYGADIERGWGRRNSTLQDFLYDSHVFLGDVRFGPDLAGVGSRLLDVNQQLLHLYNPRITVPDSMMPQYPYLFEKHKIKGRASPNALRLPEKFRENGYEVVPTREALALAQYLVSLHADQQIFEAPLIPPPPPVSATNAPAASTNAAAASNAPAAQATNSQK